MKTIDKMSNLEILQFVRDERNWMIESVVTKKDLEKKCNREFSDFLWPMARKFICNFFDKETIEILKEAAKKQEEAWTKLLQK